MFKSLFSGIGFAVGSLMALSSIALGQSNDASGMSAEQLEEVFARQKTRGLVIAPTSPETTPEASAPAGGTSVTAMPETSVPAPVAETPTYVALAPEDQVNIQISFDFDSAALRADQKPKLATLCEVMKSIDIELFRIVGHTDASGSAAYNERLSLLRAQEVKRYLTDECGVEASRLEAVGVGESFPLDMADPNGDVNRRVEFQALS